jgi:hypothetical protein
VTESQLQSAVVELAHRFGWLVAHFPRSRSTSGAWLTATAADAKGFPDCVLARKGRTLFIELKARKGHLSPEQRRWQDALGEVFVWRPADWLDGTIERALR